MLIWPSIMTNADLMEIEQKLSVKLPAAYGDLMTAPDAQHGEFWHRSLFTLSTRVVKKPIWLREVLESYDLKLRPTLIVISEIDGGDSLLLDVEDSRGQLFKYNHETNEVLPFMNLDEIPKS